MSWKKNYISTSLKNYYLKVVDTDCYAVYYKSRKRKSPIKYGVIYKDPDDGWVAIPSLWPDKAFPQKVSNIHEGMRLCVIYTSEAGFRLQHIRTLQRGGNKKLRLDDLYWDL